MSVLLQTAANYKPPARTWLIEGLLLDSSLNLIIGKPKAGKTHLTAGIIAALAGGTALGGSDVLVAKRPHRVLWVGTDAGWKGQVRACLWMNNPVALDHVLWPHETTTTEAGFVYQKGINTEQTDRRWLALAADVRQQEVDVIVVDHLLGITGSLGVNEDTAVSPFLDVLNRISEEGTSVILLHHTSDKDFGNRRDVAMGHTRITASARQILSVRDMRRDIDSQEVFIRGNETQEMALRVKPLGAGPLAVTWFGPADDRPSSGRGNRSEPRKKRVRGDQDVTRTLYLLSGPQEVRANQTIAGKYLEEAPQDIKGDITNGREVVKRLIQKGLLATEGRGEIVRGSNLKS